MTDYKLVCYGPGIAIPVPEDAKWLCQDLDGSWWVSDDGKQPNRTLEVWLSFDDPVGLPLPQPEPGPWTDQCYWIGD